MRGKNASGSCLLICELTLQILELTFRPIGSEHNKARVIDGAGKAFKRRTLT
jgi:hypothetical protein